MHRAPYPSLSPLNRIVYMLCVYMMLIMCLAFGEEHVFPVEGSDAAKVQATMKQIAEKK